jgi:hypothetical protein
MPNPAKTTDVVARFYRPLTAHEVTVVPTLLDDAWSALVTRRPTLEADLTAGTITQANVIRVLSAAVGRVLSNPQGLLEETIDDYHYRRDALVSSGALQLTDSELADVTPGRRARRSVRLVSYGET